MARRGWVRPLSRSFYVVLAVFLLSRAYILFFADIRGSTLTEVNVGYAFSWQEAQHRGLSFYDVAREFKRSIDPTGGRRAPVEYAVEYPPLAIGWMVLPNLFLPPLQDQGAISPIVVRESVQANRIAMALVDVAGFLLLLALLPTAAGGGYLRRLLFYSAAGLLLAHILYDRFDLLVGVLILASLGLLLRRAHYLASFAVLALAINVKLTPVLLVPIWILGAMPASLVAGPWDKARLAQLGGAAARRLGALLALTVAFFLPFYLASGKATLEFLRYHAQRGLQIESPWASVALVAGRVFGIPTEPAFNFGAVHVSSPLTPVLVRIAPLVAVSLVALAGASVWLAARGRFSADCAGAMTVAQAAPELITGYTVLCLFLSIVASTVFSPQYLLWLAPLIPLLAPEGKFVHRFMAAFLVICLLTTAIFPYLWAGQISPTTVVAGKVSILPPTALGIGLLAVRNFSVLLAAAGLWMWLRSRRNA